MRDAIKELQRKVAGIRTIEGRVEALSPTIGNGVASSERKDHSTQLLQRETHFKLNFLSELQNSREKKKILSYLLEGFNSKDLHIKKLLQLPRSTWFRYFSKSRDPYKKKLIEGGPTWLHTVDEILPVKSGREFRLLTTTLKFKYTQYAEKTIIRLVLLLFFFFKTI